MKDFAGYCAACVTLMNVGDSIETVLERAYQKSAEIYGPLDNMTLAFKDCLDMITDNVYKMLDQIEIEAVSVVGNAELKYLVDNVLWSKVTNYIKMSVPEISILQLIYIYKVGKTVVNLLCNTDDTVEKYMKMDCVTDIEFLIDCVYKEYEDSEFHFGNDTALDQARAYLDAMELSFRLRDADCETAYDYVDSIDSSSVGAIGELLGGYDYDGLKESIKKLQSVYATNFDLAETSWYTDLDKDYPGSGLYEKYDEIYTELCKSGGNKPLKEIAAFCLVDVYVYDQSGNMAAYVVDGRVSCSADDLTIALIGDTKVIRLYDGADYRIEYVGNDDGTMDVTIKEYDETENPVRTVNYYDVALTDGKTYSMNVDDKTMNQYEMADTADRSTVEYDYDSMNTGTAHTVTVISGTMIRNGEISIESTAAKGATLEISAYVPDGYEFERWESTSEATAIADPAAADTIAIMGDEDVTLTAVMKQKPSGNTPTTPTNPSIPSTTPNNGSDDLAPDDDENHKDNEIGQTFTDVTAGAWYEEAIRYVVTNGLMGGMSETTFEPQTTTSRAMLVTILYRLEGEPTVTEDNVFSDVPADEWYTDAVTWAAVNNIVGGHGDGTFAPNDPITREQMAAILYRCASYKGYDVTKTDDLSAYTDAGSVSS